MSKVKVQDVGVTCIMLVAKFSRVLHTNHRIVIKLHEKYLLNTVAVYAHLIEDDELKNLYVKIEDEVRQYLNVKKPKINSKGKITFSKKIALQAKGRRELL